MFMKNLQLKYALLGVDVIAMRWEDKWKAGWSFFHDFQGDLADKPSKMIKFFAKQFS